MFMFSDLARSRKISGIIMAYMVKKGQPMFSTQPITGTPAPTPEAAK
jgi:hypothetical protein